VDGVKSFIIPPEKEDYLVGVNTVSADPSIDPELQGDGAGTSSGSTVKSNLRMFPPPLFSRQALPLNYKYVYTNMDAPADAHTDQLQGQSRLFAYDCCR
jgi:general transcription factor 3C polypeptide 5 (transcription factor C subunit 1)